MLQFFLKFVFVVLLSSCCPSPECSTDIMFLPIVDCLLQESSLFVAAVCCVDPGVETSSNLHVGCTSDKISHHFLAKRLHLVDGVLFNIL